ncbi:hypothetical protein [Pontibacter akesuensis]|uniref:Uncharacterized protein n=1 Tax=Pontibacter akesuensis TaxID=388950 RepID=A0A1I7FWK1_9BACT|nr:hypothetical protein [Pontibacter akesuensis]GHA60141.1 hypothetical protein GCM10007389_10450 [Pontibacter akesuensis]SFU40594.1 hypothetical protein SAMN04487941_0517 [Pontibacter akesuensis]
MNQKRTFGSLLTLLGIAGIIWGAYAFLMGGDGGVIGKYTAAVPFIVGLIFFFSGINLIKTTKDEA